MKTDQNDYDRISDRIEEVFQSLLESTRISIDSMPVDVGKFWTAIRDLKQLQGWVKGKSAWNQ